MQQQFSALRRSSMLKVAGIGILILVMLIPMAMTRGVIHDRSSISHQARLDIMRSWGNQQLVAGPILVVPYKLVRLHPYGDRQEEDGELYLLPEELLVDVELIPEIRYRGLHEVPVYTANTVMTGAFAPPDTTGLGIDQADFDWSRAYFAVPVADARAIRNAPAIEINGEAARFEAGGERIHGLPLQIVAGAGLFLDENSRSAPLQFTIDLDIGGTDRLQYLPLGDTTSVAIRSDWPSPSFTGNHLPETRVVTEAGFNASWRVSSLGRSLPSRWTSADDEVNSIADSAFGVDLFVPVGLYQLTDRATKYAVLFIGLTFVTYFLFEVLAQLRLHPLQYLLVGFANTLFYLMLLSFAEHLGFGWSYLVSSLASTGLVAAYSSSILGGWRRAALITIMLTCLYGFLYLTLNAESYAMLAGAIGLWLILGLIMYLTRGIDWYQWGRPDSGEGQQELFAGQPG